MKQCPQCGAKTRVTNSRAGDDENHEHLVKAPREAVGWYTVDFVARSRRCTKCKWKACTIEVSLGDLKGILKEIQKGVEDLTESR